MTKRSDAINLVVNCTCRKTAASVLTLGETVRSSSPLRSRAKAWTAAIDSCLAPRKPALDLYCGGAWSIIRSAVESPTRKYGVNLWIASAGYGLIPANQAILPYSATFARSQEDSICGSHERRSTSKVWWQELTKWQRAKNNKPASLRDLASRSPTTPLFVAMSSEYLIAVEDDLILARAELSDADALVIVSSSVKKAGALASNILPGDARLEHFFGGVRASLNANVVRHILETTSPDGLRVSLLSARLERLLQRQPAHRTFERRRQGDEKIIAYMQRSLAAIPKISCSALLRSFRDENLACEQSRFRQLFERVKQNHASDV